MTCRHCEKDIPIHRVLKDREYCCPEHRSVHLDQLNRLGLAILLHHAPRPNPEPAAIRRLPGFQDDSLPAAAPTGSPDSESSSAPQLLASLSLVSPGQSTCPAASVPATASPGDPALVRAALEPKAIILRRPAVCLAICLAVVPLLAVTVVAYSPTTRVSSPPPTLGGKIRQAVRDRASVDLTEDFSDNLQRWAGPGGLPQSWSYDSAGFVRPGQLGLYIKSVPLSDYRMEFRGLIERKSLSFAYRAMDFDNYYAASITVVKPGPITEVVLERYAVINGQAGPRIQMRLPSARADTIYTVQVEARGNQFVTRINDEFVDSFTDSRLPSGGVGFFSGSDESARICWLRIVDRDDTLGKICSLFSSRFDY
jgi:hypothetical protein